MRSSRRLRGLPAIEPVDARVLILGSFPSPRSLERQEYYAHDRNRFWPVLGPFVGSESGAPYGERVNALRRARVALWDVLRACRRVGALDADIERGSEIPNDLDALLARQSTLEVVLLNGTAAAESFARFVLPRERWKSPTLRCVRLPSTSPANARYSLMELRRIWGAELVPRQSAP